MCNKTRTLELDQRKNSRKNIPTCSDTAQISACLRICMLGEEAAGESRMTKEHEGTLGDDA